mgnify:CR=1 FL=1
MLHRHSEKPPFAASAASNQGRMEGTRDQPTFAAVASRTIQRVSTAQEAEFAESCKAHLIVALSLVKRRSAAFALPPFVHRAAFLKAEEPHPDKVSFRCKRNLSRLNRRFLPEVDFAREDCRLNRALTPSPTEVRAMSGRGQ